VIKKKISHACLFDILVERRRPDFNMKEAVAKIPERFRSEARKLAEGRENGLLDISILVLLQELLQVESFVSRSEAENTTTYVAMSSPSAPPFWRNAPESGKLVEIVIHELVKDNIEFMLPESLRQARDLRKKPEIAAFRSVFLPWLDTLRAGRVDDELRLREEIRRAAMYFKATHPMRTIAHWSVIASIAIELFGGGAIGSVLHLGLDWFSGRAEHRGRWIGLSGRERIAPLTEGDMMSADQRLASRRKRGSSPQGAAR